VSPIADAKGLIIYPTDNIILPQIIIVITGPAANGASVYIPQQGGGK